MPPTFAEAGDVSSFLRKAETREPNHLLHHGRRDVQHQAVLMICTRLKRDVDSVLEGLAANKACE